MMRGGDYLKKIHQRLREILVHYFSLPSDVVMELPRITMLGDLHVYVENHKGIAIFKNDLLRLNTPNGFIQINGSSFKIKMMLPEELLLEGKIEHVTFLPK